MVVEHSFDREDIEDVVADADSVDFVEHPPAEKMKVGATASAHATISPSS
jgi:hypothetical protein